MLTLQTILMLLVTHFKFGNTILGVLITRYMYFLQSHASNPKPNPNPYPNHIVSKCS